MKSAKEIKIELERQEHLRELKQVNDLLDWVEMCISRQISAGRNRIRIFEYDHNIGNYYDKIKPILESSGYTVSKLEEVEYIDNIVFGSRTIVSNYILIVWE